MSSFTKDQYNSTGFSIQRNEIISIRQPKEHESFLIRTADPEDGTLTLSYPIDPYISSKDKMRVWVNGRLLEYGTEYTYSHMDNKITFSATKPGGSNSILEHSKILDTSDPSFDVTDPTTYVYKFIDTTIQIQYLKDTNNLGNENTYYQDGLLRTLAKDMVLNPYEKTTSGSYITDNDGMSVVAQPYNLIFPHYAKKCSEPSALNEDWCDELNGTWGFGTGQGVIEIDQNGMQKVSDLEDSINTIDNLFVIESEKGTDILSSIKDVKNSTATIPPPDGSQPAGLSVKRKPQKWRIRFYFDENDNYLHVNVGTKYQILDNGKITNTERRDGTVSTIMRLPGELSDIYLDPQQDKLKSKSGFFRRQGKVSHEYEGTYPMSYRLSTTDHGTSFYMWDQASVEQDDDFSWFVIQRQVDNRTGRIELEDGYSPVHCIYSPAKRPINIGEKLWFANSNITTPNLLNNDIYDITGAEFKKENVSIVTWKGLSIDLYGSSTKNHVLYIAEDGQPDPDPTDPANLALATLATTGTASGIITPAGNPLPSWHTPKHVSDDHGYPDRQYPYADSYKGGIYPTMANPEVHQDQFAKIYRPDRIVLTIDKKYIERARKEEYTLDSGGNVRWNTDEFNWAGTTRNSYVYDPVEHKIVLRIPVFEGQHVELRYYNYKPQASALDAYMIEVPKDNELPEYNLNVNSEGKAIYRFVVREVDVFKPWDIHKSATMSGVDSPAIINPMEQLSITNKRKFIYTFPTPLVTQRFIYSTAELDLIAYSSADSSAFSGQALIGSDGTGKYLFDRVSDIDGTYSGGTEKLDFRSPYNWHSYGCTVGDCTESDGTIHNNVTKMECNLYPNSTWEDSLQLHGWDVDTATNKSSCETTKNGSWITPSRVYLGMMSTLPNGNGMRMFILVKGGPIRPDYTDVVTS